MLNYYPLRLSFNIIEPIAVEHSRMGLISYAYNENKIDKSAYALLNEVEMENKEDVQDVYNGMKSRFYKTGRLSSSGE